MRCPSCQADLQALDSEGFRRKLIRALWHPEPQTAQRAAEILGWLDAQEAVAALLERYQSGVDPYFGATIARALRRMHGVEAQAALKILAGDPSILVRRAALLDDD